MFSFLQIFESFEQKGKKIEVGSKSMKQEVAQKLFGQQ
jgi:flagellar motor switch protein FliG